MSEIELVEGELYLLNIGGDWFLREYNDGDHFDAAIPLWMAVLAPDYRDTMGINHDVGSRLSERVVELQKENAQLRAAARGLVEYRRSGGALGMALESEADHWIEKLAQVCQAPKSAV